MWSLVITTISDKQQRKSKGLSETQIDDQKKNNKKKRQEKKQKNKAQKQKPTDPTKHQE
jgi:hypothetical protein